MMKSSPLQLPGRDQLNVAMLATCVAGMTAFLYPELVGSITDMDPSGVGPAATGLVH